MCLQMNANRRNVNKGAIDVCIVMMQNTMHDIPLQRPEELAELIVKVGVKP